MIKSLVFVALIVCSVVGFASGAHATPHAAPATVAPLAVVDFAPVTFEGLASLDLRPKAPPAHFRAHAPKAPAVDLVTRAMRAPMHCGPVHENALGGFISECTLDL